MKKGLFISMIFSLVLILAACGTDDSTSGGDSEASEGSGSTVDITASNWDFDKENYTVPAGEVTINLSNEEGMHGITIEGTDVTIEGEGSATASLEAGEYTINCTIPCGEGHEEMTSTLTVQ